MTRLANLIADTTAHLNGLTMNAPNGLRALARTEGVNVRMKKALMVPMLAEKMARNAEAIIVAEEMKAEAAAPKGKAPTTGKVGNGFPLVSAYLTNHGDTIRGISDALGVHPRTVRAAILYSTSVGTVGTFEVVGMGGSKGTAKVWSFTPAS